MALNAQTLEGHWSEIKGKLRERWGALLDDDLQVAQGNIEQLVGAIQRRTGESREAIREYLDELVGDGTSALRHAAESIRSYASNATEAAHQSAEQAKDAVRLRVREGRSVIRRHPYESIATCFAIGIVTGVILGVLTRSK
jgi:uncharacterized protein YjbJ (UPF0337 family)